MHSNFPIHDVLPLVQKTLAVNNTVILQAPPGAGKSTILPLALMDQPWLTGKKILLLEPRRLAARAVSWRLAEQLKEEPGATIGYRIRFETKVGPMTRIEIVTEGILTRMLQRDNSLEQVGMVIFDEFHERSLHADLALTLCREAQQILRPDLRILIMSATLDGNTLSALMGNAPVITSEGRQYPIDYRYINTDNTQPLSAVVFKVILKALREEHGDVLVFLPGSGDIHRCKDMLDTAETNCSIHVLYGDLPHDEQQAALTPDKLGKRKIILSTSIAETSLTIDGIRIVIDSGYARIPKYDQRSGLTHLETVRVTKDTADQRAGRAGRLGPGVCYRLWSEGSNHHLVDHRTPEILDAELSHLVLELANWGHNDLTQLAWISPPPASAVAQARILLQELNALENERITEQGKLLLEFPTHPRIAHLLVSGKEQACPVLAADVAAVLEEKDPLGRAAGADIHLRLDALNQWRKKEKVNSDRNALERIERVSRQWRTLMNVKYTEQSYSYELAGALIAAAYPERVAKREGEQGRFRLANGKIARLAPDDPMLNEEWIAIAQMDGGAREGKIFLAAPFDPADLIESIKSTENIFWDERNGLLVARQEWKAGSLIISSKPIVKIDNQKLIDILCSVIQKQGLSVFTIDEKTNQYLARISSVNKWRPELLLPDIDESFLEQHPEKWAAPFLNQIRKAEDFKKLDFLEMIKSILSYSDQQHVEKFAPEKIQVPSGSWITLNYNMDGSSPVLAVRLQEVFGLTDTPGVNAGNTPVLMHLLSPGYRPVQVTSDLRSFWKNTYPEVRKELRIRYQKHSWPEDPWTAEPIRGAKKRF